MSVARTGMNQTSIQDLNRELLLNLLRSEGECARITLAKLSGLKQATVTNIINDFIRWGIVKEVGFLTGEKGRRSIGISLNKEEYGVIGIRITRRNYSLGLFNIAGEEIFSRISEDDTGISAKEVFAHLLDSVDQCIRDAGKRKILAIGVAIPGPYNRTARRIELMTGASGWNEVPIEQELKNRYHLPIYIEQNANAAAVAQYWYNRDKLDNDLLVYIAVGQGIGAGIISDGELVRGSIGTAGEIGHTSIDMAGPRCICGNRGCLENYCSSIAFTKFLNERIRRRSSSKGQLTGSTEEDRDLTFREAAELVRKGDEDAVAVYLECCDRLAVGVVNIMNSFNPKYLMLGDEMSHVAPELMLQRVKQRVRERTIPAIFQSTNISLSVVEHDSMVNGAAIVAITDIFRHPADFFTAIHP
ncbi:MAG: ROK family protein [Bilifractor sp.]|jgi:N-acetylglucosamine repressor